MGYWEKEVEPWVHYLPVKADLSDLEKMVRYAIDSKNAEHVGWIIKNAQVRLKLLMYWILYMAQYSHNEFKAFCRTKLTVEQHTVDVLWTILAYTELLAKSKDFYPTWRSNKIAYEMPSLNMKAWRDTRPEAVFKHLQDWVG